VQFSLLFEFSFVTYLFTGFIIFQVVSEPQPSNFDIEFPPGFEPALQTPVTSACSPSISQASYSSEVETKGSTICQTTLFSDGLAEIQSTLENALYMSAKASLFEYFEDILKEELTNFIYLATEDANNKVNYLCFSFILYSAI